MTYMTDQNRRRMEMTLHFPEFIIMAIKEIINIKSLI